MKYYLLPSADLSVVTEQIILGSVDIVPTLVHHDLLMIVAENTRSGHERIINVQSCFHRSLRPSPDDQDISPPQMLRSISGRHSYIPDPVDLIQKEEADVGHLPGIEELGDLILNRVVRLEPHAREETIHGISTEASSQGPVLPIEGITNRLSPLSVVD